MFLFCRYRAFGQRNALDPFEILLFVFIYVITVTDKIVLNN